MIGQILNVIPSVYRGYARTTNLYDVLDHVVKHAIKESGLGKKGNDEITFSKLGLLYIPYYKKVGSAENAKLYFEHLTVLGINLFSQKPSWNRVENIGGMPTRYKEGSLFTGKKSQMPCNT
jgi:hypothetical protein